MAPAPPLPVLQPDSSEECCSECLDGMKGRLKKGELDIASYGDGCGEFLVCFVFYFFCMNLETFILFGASL